MHHLPATAVLSSALDAAQPLIRPLCNRFELLVCVAEALVVAARIAVIVARVAAIATIVDDAHIAAASAHYWERAGADVADSERVVAVLALLVNVRVRRTVELRDEVAY
jgi:hypothetical protein